MATPGPRKIKVFWKKCYDVIILVNDVTNKILSRDSNYIVDVVTLPKFGNSIISMREAIITSSLWGFGQKNRFFWGVVLGSSSIISNWHYGWTWNFTPVSQKG